jgi:lipopolysaccharide/colanic/teichoic acid biosynthesis glycosyltransferase
MNRRSTFFAWRSLFARSGSTSTRFGELVSQQNQFAHSIRKERARCERRSVVSEFALVCIRAAWEQDASKTQTFLEQLQNRIRITDELGWYDQRVTLLLPETDRDGAIHVANWVQAAARDVGLSVDTDICLYPWDDQWARGSRWLESETPSAESTEADIAPIRTRETEGQTTVPEHNSTGPSTQAMIAVEQRRQNRAMGTVSMQTAATQTTTLLNRDAPRTPLWKRTIDVTGAIFGLTALSPILAAAALAVRFDSRGPVLFTQLREGKDGRIFKMYKFRTMRPDAEALQSQLRSKNEQDGPAFKIEDDPRVTRVGRFLRKSCIDELPQLINVLKGDMSLVGPRPLPVHESTACQLWQRQRLTVLPGLTCIWQVSGGRQVSFDQWMRMDLDYARRRSMGLDIRLLWKTLMLVLRQRGSV